MIFVALIFWLFSGFIAFSGVYQALRILAFRQKATSPRSSAKLGLGASLTFALGIWMVCCALESGHSQGVGELLTLVEAFGLAWIFATATTMAVARAQAGSSTYCWILAAFGGTMATLLPGYFMSGGDAWSVLSLQIAIGLGGNLIAFGLLSRKELGNLGYVSSAAHTLAATTLLVRIADRLPLSVAARNWIPAAITRPTHLALLLLGTIVLGLAAIRLAVAQARATNRVVSSRERLLDLLTEEAADIILMVDTDFRLLYASASVESLTGEPAEVLIGRPLRAWLPPEVAGQFASERVQGLKPGEVFHHDLEWPSAHGHSHRIFGLTGRRVAEDEDVRWVFHLRNITEYLKDRRRMEDQEVRLRAAQSALGLGFWEWDAASDRMHWSPEVFKLFGEQTARDAVIAGRKVLKWIHPGDLHLVLRAVRHCVNGMEVGEIDIRVLLPDGRSRVVNAVAKPVRSPWDGNVRLIGLMRDVTDRREAEDALARAHNLEALGTLAGGLAHDFNNVLTVLLGHLTLVLSRVESDELALLSLREAQHGAERLRDLVRQLRTFAHGEAPVLRPTRLKDLVEDVSGFLLGGSKVRCELHFPDDLWQVQADGVQIGQVVQNLLLNADQAMPDGGLVRISARNVQVPELFPWDLADGPYVRLTVQDQGIGIPPGDLQKIFEPYFTTKASGHGLGLSIAHTIVKRHGGMIQVASQTGRGTTFQVYLSAVQGEPLAPHAEGEDLDEGGCTRVLVLDDEPGIRELAVAIGRSMGVLVTEVGSGQEAIAAVREGLAEGQAFDVAILDWVVPGGLGAEAIVGELKEMDPHLRVLVSSGYTEEPIMAHFRDWGFSGVLPKPYTVQEFAAALKKRYA